MSILFFSEDVDFPKVKKRKTAKWIKEVVEFHNRSVGDISFIFCSDSYLLSVNKQFLNHDYFTDIITFDYVENDVISGDIFISVERVAENAASFNTGLEGEMNRVIIHGILHLLGFRDKTDQESTIMREKEDFSLELLREGE
jgi:metalloprotein, YbeY/UPF0054 family